MKNTFSTGGSGFSSGADDPIMNIFTESVEGQITLKILFRSGKCGYVTNKGISCKPDETATLSGVKTITLDTFADLQAYEFKAGVPLYINILQDENKNQEDTSYSWTGTTLKWNAEVEDIWQPTV